MTSIAPVKITKEVLNNIPYEVIIYEILTYVIYETEGDNELKIKDLFGYFNEGNYRKVYQIWSNIVIEKIIEDEYIFIKIKTIPQLERLTSLSLMRCNKIEAIPQLERLTSLSLWSCEKIEVIPQLERLTSLSLYLCDKIEAIPQLERLTSLYLYCCEKIEAIPQLERLTSLTLNNCRKLKSIKEETQEKIQIYLLNYK